MTRKKFYFTSKGVKPSNIRQKHCKFQYKGQVSNFFTAIVLVLRKNYRSESFRRRSISYWESFSIQKISHRESFQNAKAFLPGGVFKKIVCFFTEKKITERILILRKACYLFAESNHSSGWLQGLVCYLKVTFFVIWYFCNVILRTFHIKMKPQSAKNPPTCNF